MLELMRRCLHAATNHPDRPLRAAAIERCLPALCTLALHPNAQVRHEALAGCALLLRQPQLAAERALQFALAGLWSGFRLLQFSSSHPPDPALVGEWELALQGSPATVRVLAQLVCDALAGTVDQAIPALRQLAVLCAHSPLPSITVQCLSELARLGASPYVPLAD